MLARYQRTRRHLDFVSVRGGLGSLVGAAIDELKVGDIESRGRASQQSESVMAE